MDKIEAEIKALQVAQARFNDAIAAGLLSIDTKADNYAGHYMYMGEQNGKPAFKHRMTREYLKY